MTLSPGTLIGPYHIIGTLGAGGMGEVYRAHDRTLGRDVAIKILSGQWLADAERRSRFEREARVLASLNHPHIGAIYGVEESGEGRALVLELIEGPTLADYIHVARAGGRPGLALEDTLAIARQIADALDAAHDRGIVHRDLKPGNVLLQGASRTDSSRQGVTAKVVDFGLAKTAPGEDSVPDLTLSPTMTGLATKQGLLMGTAAYMSPEQARGKTVDKRADIWAFGCVLYEMLAGRSPFARDTVADTFAAIVEREPEWPALPLDTPPHVRHLIGRCLEKDPRRRLRDIGDARVDLESAHAGPVTVAPAVRGSRWRLAGIAALAVLTVAAIVVSTLALTRGPGRARTMRLSVVAPQGTRFTQRDITEHVQFALAPDATRIALVASAPGARPQIWIRSLESGTAQPVAGTDDASGPFWSPDGRSLGYFARGRLWTVSLDGTPPQALADIATDVATGAWSPEGVIIFPSGVGGALLRVPAAGGTVEPATTLDEARSETAHRWPQFLPDGRRFIYLASSARGVGSIHVGSLDTQTRTRVMTSGASVTYVEPGYLLFEQNGTLTRQRFDVRSGALTGEPEPMADRILGLRGPSYLPLSAASDGTLAYWHAPLTPSELLWFDRTGRPIGRVGTDNVRYDNPVLSPDGASLLVTLRESPNVNNLWRFDLASGAGSRLTFTGGVARFATWAPDGREIIYTVNVDGVPQLFLRDARGGGEETIVKGMGAYYAMFPDDWSRHGQILVVVTARTGFDVWSLDIASGKASPYLTSPSNEAQPRMSPDGRWVAYASDETGAWETYVQGFGQARGKWQISNGGGSQPMWRGDGRELFFLGADGRLFAVPITGSATFEPGVARPLFQTRVPQNLAPFRSAYAVSPDGQRFLVASLRPNAEPSAITVVLNSTARAGTDADR